MLGEIVAAKVLYNILSVVPVHDSLHSRPIAPRTSISQLNDIQDCSANKVPLYLTSRYPSPLLPTHILLSWSIQGAQ